MPESHPANFGTSLPYRPIQQLIADADVVLAVGTEFGETDMYFTTRLPLGGVLIRIDVDPAKLSDQYAADVRIWSDARTALQSINHGLASRLQEAPARSGWRTAIGGFAKIRAEIDGSLDSKARAQWSALRAIKAALPVGRRRVQRHDANRVLRQLCVSGRKPRAMVSSFRLRHLGIRDAGGARRQDLQPRARRHCARGRLSACNSPFRN